MVTTIGTPDNCYAMDIVKEGDPNNHPTGVKKGCFAPILICQVSDDVSDTLALVSASGVLFILSCMSHSNDILSHKIHAFDVTLCCAPAHNTE